MQHGIRDLDKREQEREELNILVGKKFVTFEPVGRSHYWSLQE